MATMPRAVDDGPQSESVDKTENAFDEVEKKGSRVSCKHKGGS